MLDSSLSELKKVLIKNLDAGINGNIKQLESQLGRVNSLIHTSPATAETFLAGSDFLDGLISCFKLMNPPLRKVIITTTYLCLTGLVDGEPPKFSMLTDQLYSLKSAADAHKSGPLNANDSMVAELVTSTPLLQQIGHKLDASGSSTSRNKAILTDLASFRKSGGLIRPQRLAKRKTDKGKRVEIVDHSAIQQEMHVHRLSQITQIQDLFPELGSGFVSKLLDEYGDDPEQVIAHLLDGSLPPQLQDADRSENLAAVAPARDLAPRPTPPLLPTRKNAFDDDELDRLDMDVSRLHIGKRGGESTADDVLADRSTAPNKAAILSALAAFDSDDDERDDTYDAEDVGGTVDATEDLSESNEEVLFRAFQANPKLFDRDQATRKAAARSQLKIETGMTDEAVEGWALMLSRNPAQRKRLEARYSQWNGAQRELAGTAWRASATESGAEDSEADAGASGFRGGRGRGRGRGGGGGGGGRGGGSAAGPTGDASTEAARRRKEASKGSRANHNRRDQRARKMARGGLPG